jgi:tRNA 2-thiouridine synthesizing protein D
MFSILVNAAPYSQQGAYTAYRFCEAALKKGQTIGRIFFYGDGVNNGSACIDPPQDEINLVTRWQILANAHGIELVICVAATARRGVKNIAKPFKISGLGQLIEAIAQSERFVVFN